MDPVFFPIFFFSFKSRPPYQVEKKWVCQRWVCQKREFAVRSSSQDVKFKDPKCKHETFVRIDMKHYTSLTIS